MAKKRERFEEHLRAVHKELYEGSFDKIEKDYKQFIDDMYAEEMINHAVIFGMMEYERGVSDGTKTALAAINKAFGIHRNNVEVEGV